MRRRTYIALAGAAVVSLSGCSDDENENGTPTPTDPEPEATPAEADATTPDEDVETPDDEADPVDAEETPDETDEEPERADADTLLSVVETLDREVPLFGSDGIETFDGEGAAVTDGTPLESGLTVVVFEHEGAGNFIVELEGETETLLVNEIGATSGAVAVPTPEGEYLFDIDAGGQWSLQVGQPQAPPESIRTLPTTASGTGSDVVGPVELDGATTVRGDHDGTLNFIVDGYSETASTSLDGELLFNELGDFDGETRTDLTGVVWFDIEADGDWSLALE